MANKKEKLRGVSNVADTRTQGVVAGATTQPTLRNGSTDAGKKAATVNSALQTLAQSGVQPGVTAGGIPGYPSAVKGTKSAPVTKSEPVAKEVVDQQPEKTSTPTGETAASTNADGFTYHDFVASDIVNQAYAILGQHQSSQPGAYNPVWQDEADAYLNQYQNRDPFAYNFANDALYQQYRDMYIQQGQMASMDAMGQAAAMTGGYGNSYSQSAGQQAYNQYLTQLNAVVPELAQMAQDRYNLEGQRMLDMYSLYMDRENQEYAKYQDTYDRWYQEMARLQSNYDTLYDREYNEYLAGRQEAYDEYWRERDREYQIGRDAIEDEHWDKEYELQKKARRGSSGGGDNSYRSMSLDEQGTISKEFSRAGSINAINDLVNLYTAMGYDPNLIAQMARQAAKNITGGGNPTGGSVTGPRVYSGGGGYTYYDPDRIK